MQVRLDVLRFKESDGWEKLIKLHVCAQCELFVRVSQFVSKFYILFT